LTAQEVRKRILFVSPTREAEPLLGQLRAAGHEVSIVEELDDAQALLSSGAFDEAILPGYTSVELFTQRYLWERSGADSWRQSTAAIAHDLRNVLAALERCLEELNRAGEDVHELRRSINTLSIFLLELTDDFQAGFQPGLSLTIMDLEDIVDVAAVTVYPSAAERRQRLIIDIDDAARYLRADARKMKRALANLLAHASRQSPALGTVTVSAQRDADGCVIGVSYTAETVGLSGMSELFSRERMLGDRLAVGLRSIQDTIEQHGGRLWVESQRGAGTSIFMSVPSPEMASTEASISLTAG
jgi:two-component system sensor histidine kinase BaeS